MAFHPPGTQKAIVCTCKRCGLTIPAERPSTPTAAVVVTCPVCQEKRQYRPTEVYEGRVSYEVRAAGRR